MKKLPDLAHVLQYKNPLVIKRFQFNYPDFHDTAHEIFQNMLRYLWLSQKYNIDSKENKESVLGFSCVMHKEMVIIDEMWHTFILITKDYAQFCDDYFGVFLHHVPDMVDSTKPINLEKFKKELELFLSYVYDNLGEETVMSWFRSLA